MTEKTHEQKVAQDTASFSADVKPEDSLDDASRRELLGRIARVGVAAVPASVVLMDKAKADPGESPGFGI